MQLNYKSALRLALLTTLSLTVLHPAAAQTVTVGTPDPTSPSYFPFGDGPGITSYPERYQQLYNPADFSSPITINSIAFATDSVNSNTSETLTNVVLSLTTTATPYNNPSATFANNYTGSLTQVFNGSVTRTLTNNGSFDLTFSTTPFLYNPGLGRALLLDVMVNTQPALNHNSGQNNPEYFVSDTGTTKTYNVNTFAGSPFPQQGGLVTRFGGSSTITPEASGAANMTAALLALGMGGLALRVRTKRAVRKAAEEANA